MITEVAQANHFIQVGLTNFPIFFSSLVNQMSGITAKDNCMESIT